MASDKKGSTSNSIKASKEGIGRNRNGSAELKSTGVKNASKGLGSNRNPSKSEIPTKTQKSGIGTNRGDSSKFNPSVASGKDEGIGHVAVAKTKPVARDAKIASTLGDHKNFDASDTKKKPKKLSKSYRGGEKVAVVSMREDLEDLENFLGTSIAITDEDVMENYPDNMNWKDYDRAYGTDDDDEAHEAWVSAFKSNVGEFLKYTGHEYLADGDLVGLVNQAIDAGYDAGDFENGDIDMSEIKAMIAAFMTNNDVPEEDQQHAFADGDYAMEGVGTWVGKGVNKLLGRGKAASPMPDDMTNVVKLPARGASAPNPPKPTSNVVNMKGMPVTPKQPSIGREVAKDAAKDFARGAGKIGAGTAGAYGGYQAMDKIKGSPALPPVDEGIGSALAKVGKHIAKRPSRTAGEDMVTYGAAGATGGVGSNELLRRADHAVKNRTDFDDPTKAPTNANEMSSGSAVSAGSIASTPMGGKRKDTIFASHDLEEGRGKPLSTVGPKIGELAKKRVKSMSKPPAKGLAGDKPGPTGHKLNVGQANAASNVAPRLAEDWGSSDTSGLLRAMDNDMERMGGVTPDSLQQALQNASEAYYNMMGFENPEDAEDYILHLYTVRRGRDMTQEDVITPPDSDVEQIPQTIEDYVAELDPMLTSSYNLSWGEISGERAVISKAIENGVTPKEFNDWIGEEMGLDTDDVWTDG